eukprot:170639_1
MKVLATFTTILSVAIGIDITLKGTCDNYMSVQLDADGSGNYQAISGWSGNTMGWGSMSEKIVSVPDLSGKIKILCENHHTECTQPAGLLFTVYYGGNYYSTNGNNNNNGGLYQLTGSKSSYTSIVDPNYPWGVSMPDATAAWTWTCDSAEGWNCGDVCGEWNEYVFEFSQLIATCSDQGLSFSPQHDCQCQSECADGYCNSIERVAAALEGDSTHSCPDGTTCCCSCANCVPFYEVQ